MSLSLCFTSCMCGACPQHLPVVCVSDEFCMLSQPLTSLTRADLIIVVAAVTIGGFSEVVVIGKGDTAVITLIVTVDESRYANASAIYS